MIKLITILLGCSLTLAAAVQAEQENPQDKSKSKQVQKHQNVPKQQSAPKQHTVPATHVQTIHPQQIHPQHTVTTDPYNPKIHHNNVPNQQLHTLPTVHSNRPVVNPNNVTPVQPNKFHPNQQTVNTFQPKHQNFHAQPNSAIASARFNQNYRIEGAQNWQGNHYTAFRSYHPQWHDRGWWHSHHNHVLLIGGGWYYWNAGYWYPAWGYDNSAAYYPYDGPIYVGNNPTPLDQVVADVQTTLQEQGYYTGEIDGLVGPLTREALAAYQSAQGLEPTAAIDQPTLESLGLT